MQGGHILLTDWLLVSLMSRHSAVGAISDHENKYEWPVIHSCSIVPNKLDIFRSECHDDSPCKNKPALLTVFAEWDALPYTSEQS